MERRDMLKKKRHILLFQGRGYWYAFPEIPIGPSADKGYMKKHEARHTPISEFDNNVAHSNRNVSLALWLKNLIINNVLYA